MSPKSTAHMDWSYSTRKTKKILKFDANQTQITDYFTIAKEINDIVKGNPSLSNLIKENCQHNNAIEFSTSLLQQLFKNAQTNAEHLPRQRRHTEVIKKFSMSMLFMAGPAAYDLLHQNMPEALPSLSTIRKEMKKSYSNLIEGEFRFDKLLAHLDAHKCPRLISISEDATRIIRHIDYDENSNKLVGFVLPMDSRFLPITDSFLATSFEKIEQFFTNESRATFAYVYMAQPMSPSVPPFCLNIIGTNNHFNAKSVLSRWQHMITECTARNIQVISFSGDGDTRILKSMRISTKLYSYTSESIPNMFRNPFSDHLMSIPLHWKQSKWFAINEISNISPVQDTVHLGVKLKARLMSHSQVLLLGKFSAQSAHLSLLESTFRKEQHNLRLKDLDHQDKQNFEAVSRLTSINVISLLDEFPDTLGTKYYLLVIKNIVNSFLKKDLPPLQRIQDAWFALFFVRYWRQWILNNKQYTLENNFITTNAYICIELNAHALITFLLALQNSKLGSDAYKCYLPWLLGSQPCERAFRAARSMSSIFSTVINFSIQGLLQRLHKLQSFIELQSESESTKIIYPQKKVHSNKDGISTNDDTIYSVDNISTEQIDEAVKAGFIRAQTAMDELGMKELLEKNKQWEFAFGDVGELTQDAYEDDELPETANDQSCSSTTVEESEESSLVEVLETLVEKEMVNQEVKEKLTKKLNLTAICKGSSNKTSIPIYKKANESQNFTRDHKFIEIIHNDESIFVRKTTLVWLFQEGERVSSDRLFRVRSTQPYNKTLQTIMKHNRDFKMPKTDEQVSLGDLCVFKCVVKNTTIDNCNQWKIGRITQFANYKERLKKDRQYKNSSAMVNSAVGAMCSWYYCSKENHRLFVYRPNDNFSHISLSDSYVCTLFPSCFEEITGTTITGTEIGKLPAGSVLHTARELLISEAALDFISIKIVEIQKNEETITISTDDCTSTSKGKGKPDIWVICNGYRLYNKNKQQILNGKELTDIHINGACALLREQNPEIGGMESTLYQQYDRALMQPTNAIQILHINSNHWAVMSTLGCEQNIIEYYDSLYNNISLSTKSTITKLLQPKESFTVRIKNVAKQLGGTECGLYAIAYCVSLANGQDPSGIVYDQREMRQHLISCFENKRLTLFPIAKKRRLATTHTSIVTITVCPICKGADTGSLMVFCETCEKWFHKECVPPFDESDDEFNWMCPGCLNNDNRAS